MRAFKCTKRGQAGVTIKIDETSTVAKAWARAVERWHDRPFLAVPARTGRDYAPDGVEITYGEAARQIEAIAAHYRDAGIGLGHRVALLLENRPAHHLHKIALNTLGASCVPVNPDFRSAEIAYLVNHAKIDAAVVLASREAQFAEGLNEGNAVIPTATLENFADGAPAPKRKAVSGNITGLTEASILYTSGTTGLPKGCILPQSYEMMCGYWYATRGGLVAAIEGEDRLYTTLPVTHITSHVYTFYRMMLTGGCHIQSDRFSPSRWFGEIVATRATIIQYLGVLISMLMQQMNPDERPAHRVRFGAGASAEPRLRRIFEERYGFPLVEQWGMTEMCRCIGVYHPPRKVETRACGWPVPGIDVRVVDRDDNDVPRGEPGELLIRHSAQTPRKHFFSGYLDDDAATEHAWRGGWFHTGDIVTQDDDGMVHFVERGKNIIRRSGENIAPAEIEEVLRDHPLIRQVAVLPVPDETREEEVLACVVLKEVVPADAESSRAAALDIFNTCYRRLAYHKAPGWIYFLDELPTTGTLKIQKHQIFQSGTDPRKLPGMLDFRAMKTRPRDNSAKA